MADRENPAERLTWGPDEFEIEDPPAAEALPPPQLPLESQRD